MAIRWSLRLPAGLDWREIGAHFRCSAKFSTNPEVRALIVNWVPDCRYGATRYLGLQAKWCGSSKFQSQRGIVLKLGLPMTEQSMDGLLFFRGGRGVHPCNARNVTKFDARMYSYGLGLLPIYFYVTFDNFRTIGR